MNQLKVYLFLSIIFLFVFGIQTSAQKPNLSSFSPTRGTVGSTVTISGSNFSPVATNNTVYFGDVKAVVTNATATTLTVVVPAGVSYKPISVTVSGLTAYSILPFTVTFAGDGTAYTANSFSAKADSSWGFGVTNIGATDLDGDGDVDPVLVCTSSNFISILKNNSSIGSPSLSYSASLKYTTGTSPVFVSFGDLDGDGKQDIVVANAKDSTLSIFKNNSTLDSIQLLPGIRLSTGNSPSIIVISDIDNDGKPDVVCTNSGSNTFSVFRNTSAGGVVSFASKIDYPTGKSPYGLLVADIDGDGGQEIIVANETDRTISIFKNASTPGTISLGNKTDIPTGSVSQLAAADFDGDGKIDLAATTDLSSFFVVLRNTSSVGNYSFAAARQFSTGFGTPTALAIADIDGDGKPDVAVNHMNYSTVSAVKNLSLPGTVSFSANIDFYVSQMPPSILLTDLDNDARPDIISAGSGSSALSILRNLIPKPFISSVTPLTAGNGSAITIAGNNFLTTSQVSFGGTPASFFMVQSPSVLTAVVDTGATGEVSVTTAYGVARYAGFNFRKAPTIASFTPTKGGPGTVVTIQGTNFSNVTSVTVGNVAASSFTIVSPTKIAATVGPLNDGNYDLSVTNPSGTATLGSFYTGVTISSFYPTSGPVGTIVTINGTHFSTSASNNIVYFGSVKATVLSATATSLSVSVPAGTTFQPVSVTVNNLTAYSSQPFVVTFKGTGNEFTTSSFSSRLDSAAGSFPIYVSIADLNNDGKSDVITSNFASGSISVSKNTSSSGVTSFQYKVDYTTAKPYVWSSSTGDLDGDGKTDLIAVTGDNTVSLDRSFSVFKNASAADSIILTRTDYPIGIMNSNPRYSLIADFDEDGKPDLAFLSFSGIAVLRNTTSNGTISFAPKMDLFLNIFSESQLAFTDVDGDGRSDLVIVGNSENVYVIRNTSKPGQISFAQPISVPTGSVPGSVSLGDFDNDGKPDLAVLNAGSNSISIHKNKSTAGVVAFETRITYQLNVIPDNLALGDLDGDGKLDIAFVTTRDKFVYVMKNTSSPSAISFSEKVAYNAPYTPGHVFTGDMNNDGKADLVVNNASGANNFSVLVNTCQEDGLPATWIVALGPTEICEGGNVVLKTTPGYGVSYQWYKNGNALVSATDSSYTANTAGIYSVKISASGGTLSAAPIAVSVKSNPVAPLLTIVGNGNLCKGTAALLRSSTQVELQWYKDNLLVDGLTDSIYSVETPGRYKVMANSNGCLSSFSNEILITTSPISIPVITTAVTSFCSGDSITLTANNVAGNSYQWNVNEEQVPGATSSTMTTKNGGNFSVSVTNSKGCSAQSQTTAIAKYPAPLKPTVTQIGNTLKSSTGNGNQWYKDGVVITGATSQTFAPTVGGNYSVQVTQNGCISAMSEAYSYLLTGVVSIDNTHFIKLSPNPVHDKMIIDFKLNGIYQLNIDLFDLNGRIVKRWQDQKTGSILYLSDDPIAIYLARITSTNGKINATIKLVKQ
jgi:hypothetical protein